MKAYARVEIVTKQGSRIISIELPYRNLHELDRYAHTKIKKMLSKTSILCWEIIEVGLRKELVDLYNTIINV